MDKTILDKQAILHDNAANESQISKNENVTHGLYGWICPKCGAVMSPYTAYCPNCTRQDLNFIYAISSNLQNGVDANVLNHTKIYTNNTQERVGFKK